MRLLNFIFLVFFITTVVFLYTQQRIDAIKLSYQINEKAHRIQKLLDQKMKLEYNVARLKAPTYLEMQLVKKDVRLVQPERWQALKMAGSKEELVRFPWPLSAHRIVGLLFLKSEAEATPVTK